MTCGLGTERDATTNQCQIVCAASGRRLSDLSDARQGGGADEAEVEHAAEAAVERYLAEHPTLAARMDAELAQHMRQFSEQHFGRPALASGE